MAVNMTQEINAYMGRKDWRVKENSNLPFSFGGLNKHIISVGSTEYWLNSVYTEPIRKGHEDGYYHIHDLGGLTLYCCGFSMSALIVKGVRGIPNIPCSGPAQHLASIINQLANVVTIYQNEIMGAVAFNSVDTFLAPFVAKDKLTYDEVKQNIQNLVFSINSNSRGGAEPAFTNFTFDLTPPKDLMDKPIPGPNFKDGEVHTHKEFQKEMDMINKAFYEIMLEGDYDGEPFAYPIPTYNIHPRFDWDNPNNDLLWEMTGRFGYPYFGNFINSSMSVDDVRSMCCRLRLDLRELRKKTGGLFGADDFTGSIGVVTLNLPRLGYLADNKEELLDYIDHYMELASESLEIKREFLNETILESNAIPAFMEYVGTLRNHFGTIGHVGMNEMCMNFLNKDITEDECVRLCQDVLNFMNEKCSDLQERTGNLYNLEATPAESTCYRLALKDMNKYDGAVQHQGTEQIPYYTNSCRIPVHKCTDIDTVLAHQSQLQPMHTGGTAEHLYLGHSISGEKAKHIVKHALTNYEIPYVSLSPLTKFCPEHKYVMTPANTCPKCGKRLSKRQRVTGYIREVDNFNEGKQAEFNDRYQLEV